MKVIIAGSRHLSHPADYTLVVQAIQESRFPIQEIVSGMAKGVDAWAVKYAQDHGIRLREFYAQWEHGRWAGHIRNKRMAEYADALVAVWDGRSKGTENMIKEARFYRRAVFVFDAEL